MAYLPDVRRQMRWQELSATLAAHIIDCHQRVDALEEELVEVSLDVNNLLQGVVELVH